MQNAICVYLEVWQFDTVLQSLLILSMLNILLMAVITVDIFSLFYYVISSFLTYD